MDDNNGSDLYTRRSSVRLPGFDYASTGAYFVTVCTDHRKPIFEIPKMSKLLVEIWETLPGRFSSTATFLHLRPKALGQPFAIIALEQHHGDLFVTGIWV